MGTSTDGTAIEDEGGLKTVTLPYPKKKVPL